MIEPVELKISEITPLPAEVLCGQGIPKDAVISERINDLIEEAVGVFLAEAAPVSIIKEITLKEFGDIFNGDGKNEEEAPLQNIYPHAGHISLFALTIGREISQRISELFTNNDYALGSMLDSAASIAADKSVEQLERHITQKIIEMNMTQKDSMVLSYSPGYCGWHITAQKKLFLSLHPEEIGITLNESCLMEPLKSVTGALIYCNKELHSFEKGFSFCGICRAQSCIERRKRILTNNSLIN